MKNGKGRTIGEQKSPHDQAVVAIERDVYDMLVIVADREQTTIKQLVSHAVIDYLIDGLEQRKWEV